MFILLKRSFYALSNKIRRLLTRPLKPAERMKEKWTADFSKPEKSCFTIKSEISRNAYLEKGSLFLGLKKKNCMTWLETAHRVYVDQIINARFRFDNLGGYCAAGIMFRMAGQETYYLALVSSKGYFRLDAVNNNIPRPLIGWIEASGFNNGEANLRMVIKDDHLIFFLNGRWIAETHDDTIPGGHLGFALVSYETDDSAPETELSTIKGYTCLSWLDFLSVDSRAGVVAAEYKKWYDSAEISAESRFRLAKSLASLNYFDSAYNQILKAWKQREESAKTVTATYTEMRTRGELLFAAQMALQLEQYAAAEEYLNICFTMGIDGEEALNVFAEKAKILSIQNKYSDLIFLLPDYIKRAESFAGDSTGIPSLYALLGHACWNLNDYAAAAAAWDKAFNLDSGNSLYEELKNKAEEKTGKKTIVVNAAKRTAAKPEVTVEVTLVQKTEIETKPKPKVKTVTARKTTVKPKAKAAAAKSATVKTAAAKKTTTKTKSAAKAKPATKTKTAAVKKTAVKAKPAAAKKTAAATKPRPRGRPRKTTK